MYRVDIDWLGGTVYESINKTKANITIKDYRYEPNESLQVYLNKLDKLYIEKATEECAQIVVIANTTKSKAKRLQDKLRSKYPNKNILITGLHMDTLQSLLYSMVYDKYIINVVDSEYKEIIERYLAELAPNWKLFKE